MCQITLPSRAFRLCLLSPGTAVCTMPGFACFLSTRQAVYSRLRYPVLWCWGLNSRWPAYATVISPICYDVLIFKFLLLF